jgi:hypothetical protein
MFEHEFECGEPATAVAQREGAIGAGQVTVIRQFFDEIPSCVDVETQSLGRTTAGSASHRVSA